MTQISEPKSSPMFVALEIELNSRCNRKCTYCPLFHHDVPDVPEFMKEAVINRIIEELKVIDFNGRISFHLYSEPLLMKNLEQIIARFVAALPRAKPILFTNGDFLDDERYQSLISAGVFHIVVTSHSNRPVRPRRFQTIVFPSDLPISNRGGSVYSIDSTVMKPCYIPSSMMLISVTGEVLLCCDDFFREYPMGNVLDQSLPEIWFSKRFNSIREQLNKGNRNGATAICNKCDNVEGVMPWSSERYIVDVINRGRPGYEVEGWSN